MDGNGTITTQPKDDEANTVGFDWDDSGFNKQVAWVKPNDGFLFLDRDSNGVVSSGRELFSNSQVSDNYKGIRSIEWIDGNRDGKINSLDPAYAQIKIWQDTNQDGDRRITTKRIARCAGSMPARGRKCLQTAVNSAPTSGLVEKWTVRNTGAGFKQSPQCAENIE